MHPFALSSNEMEYLSHALLLHWGSEKNRKQKPCLSFIVFVKEPSGVTTPESQSNLKWLDFDIPD